MTGDINNGNGITSNNIQSQCLVQDHAYNITARPIELLSINVCGLMSKLNIPDFVNFISGYDIISILETKLDDADVHNVDIDNFKFVPLNRSKFVNKSGGIGFFIRSDWYDSNKVTVVGDTPEHFLLLKLDGSLCGFDLICGAVYIEPERSKYAKPNAFIELENYLTNYYNLPVLLLGDFNARTAVINDFLDDDDYNVAVHDDEVDLNTRKSNLELLQECGISLDRFSKDKQSNNYGRELISLCQNAGLLIANGRIGKDACIGKFTCKDSSVVDYCLASYQVMPSILDFEVKDFNDCFSDIHCALHVCLKPKSVILDIAENNQNIAHDKYKRPKWESDFENVFNNYIDVDKVNEISAVIGDLDANSGVTSQNDIDNLYEDIKAILTTAAQKCGSIKVKSGAAKNFKKRKKYNKWWNDDCENHRARFNAARKRSQNSLDDQLLINDRKVVSKEYKKAINRAIRNYHKEVHKKIRSLKSKNPKDYWKIINGDKDSEPIIAQLSCEAFTRHFQKINMSDNVESHENLNFRDADASPLNVNITRDELLKCIKNLNNNKACGIDIVINEFLKSSKEKMCDLYVKFFNLVLKTCIIPKDWVIGLIKPLYKNKGSKCDVDNYRPITLLSCVGKLFTYLLNARLTNFVETNNIILEVQAGFRHGYSTMDHIFSLSFIINLYLSKGKRLYCAFVDYAKAFDRISRAILWKKLISVGIEGRILKVIYNLYKDAKSCVKYGSEVSDFFPSNVGVRQGENLSPLLFALFLNDLVPHISESYSGLNYLNDIFKEHMSDVDTDKMFKLYLLLYADDTVIFAESPNELQNALDSLHEYCVINKLNVNTRKTKVLVFSKGKIRNIPKFTFNNSDLEVVFDYNYLGVTFNYNGRFRLAQKNLYDKASRAMFGLIAKCRRLFLPIDLRLQLFDSVIKPIVLYGSEVWGFDDIGLADKLQLRFIKNSLSLKMRTPTVMVRGETGCYPCSIDIKCRVLNYWHSLGIDDNDNKIVKEMYNCIFNLFSSDSYVYPWLKFVKSSLDDIGLTFIFLSRNLKQYSKVKFKKLIKLKLQDQFKQDWLIKVNNHERCLNYRIFKKEFVFESYLTKCSSFTAKQLLYFRTGHIKLPVSTFCSDVNIDKTCKLCDSDVLCDEFHVLLSCKALDQPRKDILKLPRNLSTPNTFNFDKIMSKQSLYINLAKFIKHLSSMLSV